MSVNTTASTISSASTGLRAGALLPSMLSVFFGLFMVGVVGFSQIDVLHNVAHDTRHTSAFPCH